MTNNLQKQVHIYSLDTSAFYNEYEQKIHRKLLKSYRYQKHLKKINNQDSRKKFVRVRIKRLKNQLKDSLVDHSGVRNLDDNHLMEKNIISIFDSVLTRTLGVKEDSITEEIFVVRTYYFEVLKDLIHNGFIHNGEKYIYFSSSAGQIRTKKGVWIKESSWDKYKNTLTCGLNVKDINKQGGSNINKYLAYIALTNSATTGIENFNIHKSIVVDDLETNVNGLVDYIDESYDISRKQMDIPIEHTDGCGIILPKNNKKTFMVRLPFIKGMLVPFPFDKFAKENNSYIVKDIYGKQWDVIKDDIQIIFTKSQFKMWKFYNDWEDYKTKFIKYNCQAAMLNEEENVFPEAKLNYQMLQTLTDITRDELEEISQSTVDDILEIGSDKETMLRVLGATKNDRRMNSFQSALSIYNELLNDTHARQVIKDVKRSLVRDGKAGKLNISGKYTFICPDLFAFCERLFLGEENPKGLLGDGEVYCQMYDEGKLDILRSPHLYREHGIRTNIKDKNIEKWFVTKGIYTSVHDVISKMLQFDVDGDKALVVDDSTFVEVAERNMEGIVPLYYEMATAPKQDITREEIYKSLILAFNANIGEISNNITKIWNSDDVNLDVIKWLCMENNFVIDFAKTLYKPKRPVHVNNKINEYIKTKVPYFFIHAKDKDGKNVANINESTVNSLEYIIPERRIHFSKVAGKLDYKMLMRSPRVKIDEDIVNAYTYLDRRKKWIMGDNDDSNSGDKLYIYRYIREELLLINNDIEFVTDVLVKHLYYGKDSISKTSLWESFGDVILNNIRVSVKENNLCSDCKSLFKKFKQRQFRCYACQNKKDKENARLRKSRQRNGI